MFEYGSRDRLRPFLLDRLTDDRAARGPGGRAPGGAAAATGGAATGETLLDRAKYRERLKRDLAWLLNTQAPAISEGVEQFPDVASSVLNYGIPDLSRLLSDNISGREVERWITTAIQRFEPRIVPETLVVRIVEPDADKPGALQLEIEGDVWAVPEPEPIYLRTEIDLGTGGSDVADRTSGMR